MRALVRKPGTSRAVAPAAVGGNGSTPRRRPKARVPDAVHWGGLGRRSAGIKTGMEEEMEEL